MSPLRVEIREANNYGSLAFYPANDQARLIADVAGTKTLTARVLYLLAHSEDYKLFLTFGKPLRMMPKDKSPRLFIPADDLFLERRYGDE